MEGKERNSISNFKEIYKFSKFLAHLKRFLTLDPLHLHRKKRENCLLSISDCTIFKLEFIYLANSQIGFSTDYNYLYVIFLNCLIRCVLRSLKVNKLCKIAPSRTSEACLSTCVCYFMAAIIKVITTYGTFNICGITSHKTSAIRSVSTIRRKMQTNGHHILHDKKIGWQRTNLFQERASSVRTFR